MVSEILPDIDLHQRLLDSKDKLYELSAAAKQNLGRGARSQQDRLENFLSLYTIAGAAKQHNIDERIPELLESAIRYSSVREIGYLFAEGSNEMRLRGKLEGTNEADILDEVQRAKQEFLSCISSHAYERCATLLSKMHTAERTAYGRNFTNGKQIQQELHDLYAHLDKHTLVTLLTSVERRDITDLL